MTSWYWIQGIVNIRKIPKFMCAQAYKIGGFLSQELSAEIGDSFGMGRIDKPEKNDNLIKYWSILLAEYIKTVHKKSDLFQSRLFTVFATKVKFLSDWFLY